MLVAVTVSPAPSQAQTDQVLGCPELTDSIIRLQYALYDEPPPPTIAHHWAAEYQTGQYGLVEVANRMVASDRFSSRYGAMSDAGFVGLIFANTIGRSPSVAETEAWVDGLEGGLSRGELALNFTETQAFTAATQTVRPLAGYGRWYPAGARWYCGQGREERSIVPLFDTSFVDFFAVNEGSTQLDITFSAYANTEVDTTINASSIPSGFQVFGWDRTFVGDGYYGNRLVVATTPSIRWAVVFYPESIGSERTGWQIADIR